MHLSVRASVHAGNLHGACYTCHLALALVYELYGKWLPGKYIQDEDGQFEAVL